MASTAIDKTYFHPFVKFFYIGDDRKKFSVMQNIVDRTNVYGLKKSEEAIATLDLALQYCVESKISMKDAIGLVDDGKKFIDVMQFLLDILSNKEIDDAIALKTVNNFKIILFFGRYLANNTHEANHFIHGFFIQFSRFCFNINSEGCPSIGKPLDIN